METPHRFPLAVGRRGAYQWLATEQYLDDLLALCPQLVLGRYIAITSIDSGSFYPNEKEIAAGWANRGGVAYSPRVEAPDAIPREGWDEWYVFDHPADLGVLAQHKNPFEASVTAGEIYAFVNMNIQLHVPTDQSTADYFWKQFDWIKPVTYIAESDWSLQVITSDRRLFDMVHDAVRKLEGVSEQ